MSRRYGKGKRAVAVCDRGGHKIPYRRLVIEPGTGLRVDKYWSDGYWNIRDHPQNFSPKHLDDEKPLKNPTYDTLVFSDSFADVTLILCDEQLNPLTDEVGQELTDEFGYKFALSYGK